ncbi:uncharacterized protein KQ657_000625 [Scheffersomyces spartinae]|uniref:Peptide hydrolase n=1 Tax=Scheffersomyces spartinae TaxID=45513 RepID=A0A9P7V8X9_9ASCO|nr:uncharacterized protein KQ657_000625 [Scheffersomyces spartinae]KAG7193556.1 hypothetical protein KQ657_000625 [Scheffersomyces spartinae]
MSSDEDTTPIPGTSAHANKRTSLEGSGPAHHSHNEPNIFVRGFRGVFGYRKTTLTLLVIVTLIFGVLVCKYDNSLDYTVSFPTDKLEVQVLDSAWTDLQVIAKQEHTYGSKGNDVVYEYLDKRISSIIKSKKTYVELDHDNTDNNSSVMYSSVSGDRNTVTYYESNNLIVRVNGSDETLPALLLSAHYDSVPSSFGVTDDGMGVASLLGLLDYYCSKKAEQPKRTIIFNFNNNEEFGLYGATSFVKHPWFSQIGYFLNLEGTGAGGKAILFRGTDYGIAKYYSSVRFPYGTSIFQQGFNNHLIHSETDYKVYKEMGGLRGLDVAFYKPRDLYHTALDNIRNVDEKSLWHMLSTALDFTNTIVSGKIDLDEESFNKSSTDTAVYQSFLNFFVSFPVSQVVVFNIALLVVAPLINLLLLVIIFGYKKNWTLSFINVVKFPVSLFISMFALNFINDSFTIQVNKFLPNSSAFLILATYASTLFLFNYLIMNGVNQIFYRYKVVNHDEKLIVMIEIALAYWIVLIYSTTKLKKNKLGDDHSGELIVSILFLLQSLAIFFGLLSWVFKHNGDHVHTCGTDEGESEPLLGSQRSAPSYVRDDNSGFIETSSIDSRASSHKDSVVVKFLSYDWLLQFLIIVPISFVIFSDASFFIIDGVHKSLQESLVSEKFIYQVLQISAVALVIPFLPFVFKFNRLIVLVLVCMVIFGYTSIVFDKPFDEENPMKLRFIQSIDLNVSPTDSYVNVFGREKSGLEAVVKDLPSFKLSKQKSPLLCDSLGDGNEVCSFKSSLPPVLSSPNNNTFADDLKIDILKNSSSNKDHLFGLLTGEIRITVPENRMCHLSFNRSESKTKIVSGLDFPDTPVKTVIVYSENDNDTDKESRPALSSIPEGFSRDKAGNYLYKDLKGINDLQLLKLDWKKSYHIGFQWVPSVIDLSAKDTTLYKLGVNVECFWAELRPSKDIHHPVPAYEEVLHYSPSYVSWANKDRGLVVVSKYIDI